MADGWWVVGGGMNAGCDDVVAATMAIEARERGWERFVQKRPFGLGSEAEVSPAEWFGLRQLLPDVGGCRWRTQSHFLQPEQTR